MARYLNARTATLILDVIEKVISPLLDLVPAGIEARREFASIKTRLDDIVGQDRNPTSTEWSEVRERGRRLSERLASAARPSRPRPPQERGPAQLSFPEIGAQKPGTGGLEAVLESDQTPDPEPFPRFDSGASFVSGPGVEDE